MKKIMHRQQQANKICGSTWDRQAMNSHKMRLGQIKSHIDTQAPKVYPHLINRSKKEQMLEERYTQIEYENRILLKKMSRIMRTSSIDNLNYIKPKSLNSVVRKNELRKIMDENQQILKRIQNRRPYYNRKEWDNHEINHSKYLENIRERPVKTLPLLNDKYANQRSHSAPPRRNQGLLLAPIDDDAEQHVIRKAKPARPTPLKSKGSAQKKKSPKKKGADRVEISKGGKSIDGQFVIVTVDEIFKPEHCLEFKSYDLDTSEHHEVKVSFDTIKTLVDPAKLNQDKREELSNDLMARLKFDGSDLKFDSTPPPAGEGGSSGEPAANADTAAEKPAMTEEEQAAANSAEEKKIEGDKAATPAGLDESYGEGSFDENTAEM